MQDGAAGTIFRYVGGVPRLINTLMDAVLSEAAVRRDSTVSTDLINEVARELGWKPLASQRARSSRQPDSASKTPSAKDVPQSSSRPMSEASAMLLLDPSDTIVNESAKTGFPKAADKAGDHPGGFPEMSASDTSATGMLRLEELDARFAETIFGEDATKSASDAVAAEPEIPEKFAV